MVLSSSRPRRFTILQALLFLHLLLRKPAEGFVISRHLPKHVLNVPRGGAASFSSLCASFPNGAAIDPLLLQHVAVGGALAFAGDVIAQSLTNPSRQEDGQELSLPPPDWDRVRTAALAAFGALYTGGAQHFIFGWLNGQFTEPLYRLLLAQFCFIPFCYYPTFLLMVPTLRAGFGPGSAEKRERLTAEIVSRLPATLLRNWCFWLPVQAVQFSFIPTDLQVTYCAVFGVVWNAILSWSTMQSSEDEPTDEKDQ
jgi:hypothetical protein